MSILASFSRLFLLLFRFILSFPTAVSQLPDVCRLLQHRADRVIDVQVEHSEAFKQQKARPPFVSRPETRLQMNDDVVAWAKWAVR